MKKIVLKIYLLIVVIISVVNFSSTTVLSSKEIKVDMNDLFLTAYADDEGGYSCTASASCYLGDEKIGSVSCTGTETCSSGYEWVKCDGNRSECSDEL